MSDPLPNGDDKRLDALRRLPFLSSQAEDALDRIVETARRTFDVTSAAVTVVDRDQSHPQATAGPPSTRGPAKTASAPNALRPPDDVLVVEDARSDDRFGDGSVGRSGVRFYAGAPLIVEGEHPVGALSLYDTTPQTLSADDRRTLTTLARLVVDFWDTNRRSRDVPTLLSALEEATEPILITEGSPIDAPGPRIVWVNEALLHLTGYDRPELIGKTPRLLQGPDTSPATRSAIRDALEAHEPVEVEITNYRKDGTSYVAVVGIAPVFDDADELTYWISFHHDVTDRRRQEEQLKYEATHDSLTGLANRTVLQEEVERFIQAPDRAPTALLYLDLDRFKLVNDSLGHSNGDELLGQIARILRDIAREHDTVARIGGDEFAVFLPNLDDAEQAHTLAERIYDRLNQPIELGERSVFTPASIGVVVGLADYDCVEDVLRDADTAMYEAKDDLRQPFAVYEEAMTQRVEEQLSLDTEIRQALEREEFEPFFHPVVDLADGSLQGFEVLARWQHPDKGVLTPSVFLEAAEVTGLIVPIGHQVIRKACAFASELRERRGSSIPLALTANFSRQEFFQAETYTLLTDLFATYEVEPQDFTMEISERTIADISEDDESGFQALKDLGVEIILDDFGTGFSSLQSLRRLPVDGLKIDKELLGETGTRSWDRELVDLVIQMGHTLGQTVTAEGIETVEQLSALRAMDCSYGQGFLFTPPVPASDVESLLDEMPWAYFWSS